MKIVPVFKKYFAWLYLPFLLAYVNKKSSRLHKEDAKRLDALNMNGKPRVYYLGITSHSNLGDMAQHYCICKWIEENYPSYDHILFESNTIVDPKSGFMERFIKIYRSQDMIVFQSGYTTQDLGGNHDEMHRLIIENMPEANILMMPQTIFFANPENKKRTATSYDKAKHMLFLARDFVSYESAKEMFPHQTVKAFPDIVTTLIGTLQFNNQRDGIGLCLRNDTEKFYSKIELDELRVKLEQHQKVSVFDTTISVPFQEIRENKQKYIEAEIEKFSHFKVIITDRYHGTIFSLVAGTPVIIIKTTDHKVTTGADWFKGVYDNYVSVAENLDIAYVKAKEICSGFNYKEMPSYFKQQFYDKLKSYFQEVID
jgi:exopolysaccharide biosynthesis predicted pyruvyltransferase EpsI